MQVGLFDESLKHVQDYDMMFKLFQKHKPVVLNKCLFYSRHHSGQSSVKYQNKAFLEKTKLSKIFKDSPVFLIGFPRSGTTLLDTILRSHPDIDVL